MKKDIDLIGLQVFEASINDCAKMFTVQNIAESLLKENQFNIKDLINIRKSCLMLNQSLKITK
jgi:hypothetical protein